MDWFLPNFGADDRQTIADAIAALPARARLLDQADATIRGAQSSADADVVDAAATAWERLRVQHERLNNAAAAALVKAREAGALDGLEGLGGLGGFVDGVVTVSAGVALVIVGFLAWPVSVALGVVAAISGAVTALVGALNLLVAQVNAPAPAPVPGSPSVARTIEVASVSLVSLVALGVGAWAVARWSRMRRAH